MFFWFFLVPWMFVHYGKWMDATDNPKLSDIIVCLGGGTEERLNTAVKLYTKGYSKQKHLLLIGESYDTQASLKQKYPQVPIEQHHQPTNTKEEVLYIKQYLVKHGYTTALVVTDPPHSRRVWVLDVMLGIKNDGALNLHIVSSGVSWWKAEKYYDDERSGKTVLSETIRILYSILCYGIVDKLGGACE